MKDPIENVSAEAADFTDAPKNITATEVDERAAAVAEPSPVVVVPEAESYTHKHRVEFHARLKVLAKELVDAVSTRSAYDHKVEVVFEKLKAFGG